MNSQLNCSTRISVIVPCFNAAETMRQQLDALAAQSVQPWEVIIADNGSTDRSIAIAKEYAGKLPKLRIIDASARRGASHARNAGAKVATGDYLAFCDADDVVSPHWLAALQEAFTQHNFVASRFDYTLLNQTSDNPPQTDGLQNFRIPFMPFAGGCGLGIRRSVHEAVSGFDEDLSHFEDVDYCLRVQLRGIPLVFVPNALIHIRYTSPKPMSFFSARKGSFRHGYNWGMGQANLYKRYRAKGMQLHGLVPRLIVSTGCALRCFLSGFSCNSVWRMGWHAGVLSGFIQNRILQL